MGEEEEELYKIIYITLKKTFFFSQIERNALFLHLLMSMLSVIAKIF
jgi:hypothetical protein